MAEKKTHTLVSAETKEEVEKGEVAKKKVEAKPVGNASGLRIGAVALWVAAIGLEICALLVAIGKLSMKFMPTLWQLILFIVLDFACVVAGAQLWKKANHIDPASEKNKVKFWLWNNMGFIVCIFAFVPFIIVLLLNKEMDKKTKAIAIVVALIALLIGGVSSIDWNPVSQEQKEAAVETLGDAEVYWAPFGKVYHTHEECGALNHTDTLTVGSVEEAIASNRTRLCSFCANQDAITDVVTDGAEE